MVLLLALLGPLEGQTKPPTYTGHYELAEANSDSVFSLDVTQTGNKVEFSFSAGMTDGSGAAPDGGGKGTVGKDGTVTFTFTDSFDNEGKGTLVKGTHGYILQMDPTKVVEPRPLRFYDTIHLKKTSDKPSPT